MQKLIKRAVSYYAGARHRAERRKSLWNVPLLILSFAAWAAILWALFRAVWLFHILIYPEHELKNFWQDGISFGSFIFSFLMVFALVPGACASAFMLVNLLFRLIPPASRTFEAEARDYPGTDFRGAMHGLFRIWFLTFPAGLLISIAAASLLKSLR